MNREWDFDCRVHSICLTSLIFSLFHSIFLSLPICSNQIPLQIASLQIEMIACKIIACDFSHSYQNPFNRLLLIAGNCIVWLLVCAIITTLFMPCWMVDQMKKKIEWRYIYYAYSHNLAYFVSVSFDSKD